MEWGEDQKKEAEERVAENSLEPVSEQERDGFETQAASYWNSFYQQHQNK